jgi:hypothetical protein
MGRALPTHVPCTYMILPGANPAIASYNATGSLARFENKNILYYFEKRSSLLQRWRCSYAGVVAVNSKVVVGLAPASFFGFPVAFPHSVVRWKCFLPLKYFSTSNRLLAYVL